LSFIPLNEYCTVLCIVFTITITIVSVLSSRCLSIQLTQSQLSTHCLMTLPVFGRWSESRTGSSDTSQLSSSLHASLAAFTTSFNRCMHSRR